MNEADKELERLKALPEEDVDTSDIPEVTNWSRAQAGRFYRPVKQPVTLRLDADVVVWFKTHFDKYQPAMNAALRKYMEHKGQGKNG